MKEKEKQWHFSNKRIETEIEMVAPCPGTKAMEW